MDNEKEISYGAFDSELMHQEITIPEGFEATIEGNKIILKKTESDDVKIRKELIKVFSNREKYLIDQSFGDITVSEALTWLEKQGEHKKFRDSIQVGDKVTRNRDGVIVNLSQLNRVAKKDEKQSETFTKKDVDNAFVEGMALAKDELEKQGVQKPAWSEKDEELLNEIINNVKGYDAYTGNIVLKFGLHENKIKWLKSIRNRVLPQPKQDWSEEDEKMRKKTLLVISDDCGVSDYEEISDWLKSLKERCTWKPSYKQTDALKIAADGCADQTVSQILSTLYKDLKKLTK